MPLLDDDSLRACVFFFKDHDAASRGDSLGGSGLLVGVPFSAVTRCFGYHLYAATVAHVARSCPVARLATKDGFESRGDPSEWVYHPKHDDVAVLPLGGKEDYRKYRFLESRQMYVEPDHEWSPGGEVMMIGRFLRVESPGQDVSVRLGIVSMPPREVPLESGLRQEAFLVEMHSQNGYSGSAVFPYAGDVYRARRQIEAADKKFDPKYGEPKVEPLLDVDQLVLLGLDCGHFPSAGPVIPRSGQSLDWRSENSGMSVVVPSWKLSEVLNTPELCRTRLDDELEAADNAGLLD